MDGWTSFQPNFADLFERLQGKLQQAFFTGIAVSMLLAHRGLDSGKGHVPQWYP